MNETPYMAQRRKLQELREKQTAGEAPASKSQEKRITAQKKSAKKKKRKK